MTGMSKTLELPIQLDHEGARWLHEQLSLRQDQGITLSAAKVSFLGGLAAQIIIAAARQWRERSLDFKISPRSAAFDEGTVRIGLKLKDIGQE